MWNKDRAGQIAALLRAGFLAVLLVTPPASGAAAQTLHDGGAAQQFVQALDVLFGGEHKQLRAVHAKGVVVLGAFTAAPGAAALSRAPHLAGGTVPVIVRFSNFAGVGDVADGAKEASPRGMAIRFELPDEGETDIVAHSYDGFPAATPADFLAFLRALPDPEAIARFARTRPAARAFLAAPLPTPASYATETFFGVNAFRFTNAAGLSRLGRYRIVPLAGERHLSPEQAAAAPHDFLRDELSARLAGGPVGFRLLVQLAGPGDDVDDGSKPWPADRPCVELGTLTLRTLAAHQRETQQALAFRPTSLVDGIAPSDDPMLLARTQAYRASDERREPRD